MCCAIKTSVTLYSFKTIYLTVPRYYFTSIFNYSVSTSPAEISVWCHTFLKMPLMNNKACLSIQIYKEMHQREVMLTNPTLRKKSNFHSKNCYKPMLKSLQAHLKFYSFDYLQMNFRCCSEEEDLLIHLLYFEMLTSF